MIIASPGATPVTTPALDTVATVRAVLDHMIGCPLSVSPAASRTVAVKLICSRTSIASLPLIVDGRSMEMLAAAGTRG
jgi:hypothetical protein